VKRLVASFLLLLGMVFFLPLPENGAVMDGLDPAQLRLGLGLFVCIAFLWMTEALPLSITALLVPVLATVMGLGGMKETLAPFANPLIFVFFGGFALAAALSAQGLDRWLASRLGLLGKGKFLYTAIWFFVGTAFISMWMSNTATTAMMLPLALGMLNQFKSKESQSRNTYFLLLGLAYSASIGGLGTKVGSPPNGIAADKLGISFAEWMVFGVPAMAVLLPAMIGLLWLLLRPENVLLEQTEITEEKFVFNKQRWLTLVIFLLTALAWMFGTQLEDLLGFEEMDTWVALIAACAVVSCKLVSWKEVQEKTDWGVLLLFGGGLALSAMLGSSGASLFMARLLGSTLEAWPVWAVIAAVVAFVIFLGELTSNTATAALLVPIFFTMATEFGLSANQLVLPLALATSCSFMLPVGTPPNAIVFGTGKIPQRAMMKTGFYLNIVFVVLITALSLLLF
jgi:solute carrier family 13 (sodium-dependent dicarboxylate transporter), member 2/3/5